MAIFHVFSLSDCILLVSWFLPHRLWLRWSGYSSDPGYDLIRSKNYKGGVASLINCSTEGLTPNISTPPLPILGPGSIIRWNLSPVVRFRNCVLLKGAWWSTINHSNLNSLQASEGGGRQSGTDFPALQTLGFTTFQRSTLLWSLVLAHSSVFSHYYT